MELRVAGSVRVERAATSVSLVVHRGQVAWDDAAGQTNVVRAGAAIELPLTVAKSRRRVRKASASARAGKGPATGGSELADVAPAEPSISLLEQADAARRARRFDEAAGLLRRHLAQHPSGSSAASAAFTLGLVERQRGRAAAAADAFARCRRLDPMGALAEDAWVEEAEALAAAGRGERAAALARRYVSGRPSGTYRVRMKRLLDD
ncbi:MAG: tetratricopeptide repeat protein [Myxococcales bacterium FL481]|nr:MAG: tetratricopeptide repeat protein [Myxococcales bacterium FL481]